MAKKPNRTQEADNLRNLRQYGDTWRDLAKNLLEKEKLTSRYIDATWEWRKLWKELAEKLIEKWEWYYVAENLDKFEWLDHKEIANKLIEKWKWYYVAKNLDKFEWLDKETAEKLIEKWEWDVVAQHPEKFWLKKEK